MSADVRQAECCARCAHRRRGLALQIDSSGLIVWCCRPGKQERRVSLGDVCDDFVLAEEKP